MARVNSRRIKCEEPNKKSVVAVGFPKRKATTASPTPDFVEPPRFTRLKRDGAAHNFRCNPFKTAGICSQQARPEKKTRSSINPSNKTKGKKL